MNRKDFLKRFGIGIGAVAIAPKVIAEAFDKKDCLHVTSKAMTGENEWAKDLQTIWKTQKPRCMADLSEPAKMGSVCEYKGSIRNQGHYIYVGDNKYKSLMNGKISEGRMLHYDMYVVGSATPE